MVPSLIGKPLKLNHGPSGPFFCPTAPHREIYCSLAADWKESVAQVEIQVFHQEIAPKLGYCNPSPILTVTDREQLGMDRQKKSAKKPKSLSWPALTTMLLKFSWRVDSGYECGG